jgi:Tfp pilus assembly protein PilW
VSARGECGFPLVELIVGMFSMIVILTAIMMLVRVSTTNQDRVAERVAANQKIRPVMTSLIDTLHSACIAPGINPVRTGSTGSSMVVYSKAGSTVSPTPDRRVVTLTGSTLTEQVYPATGGTIPNWTFSPTPSSSRTLATGISAGAVGDPPVAVPVFRYYAYTGDTLQSTPLTTPLSSADAARTAHVSITFAAAPAGNVTGDEQLNRITLTDSANLRLESASDSGVGANMPCD